jgi:hypothetical protein
MAQKRNGGSSGEQPSVLGTLPTTRPERLGAPRRAAAKRAPSRNGAAPKARAKHARPAAVKATPKPTAVRPASPPLTCSRATATPPPKPLGLPTGTELLTTSVRAVGELAQIGLTVGGLVVKRAVDRIPRP